MKTEKYNGYTNYETWHYNLVINNEEWSQKQVFNASVLIVETTPENMQESKMVDYLKDNIPADFPYEHSTEGNMCNGDITEVDYWDVAENWISEARNHIEMENAI